MELIYQLPISFAASAAFGLIFDVPRNKLVHCGTVGMIGWLIYSIAIALGLDPIPATFIAALIVASISQMFSKLYRTPIINFSVVGIIPLVPGGLAYDAMRNFVGNQYDLGMQLSVKALLISGAIAIGLVFSEVVYQVARRKIRQG